MMTTTTLEEETLVENRQEERIFDSEIRRIDSEIGNIKKSADKQEDRFTRAFEKLEATLEAGFEKIDQRFENLDSKLNARMDKIDDRLWILLIGVAFSILAPVLLRFF